MVVGAIAKQLSKVFERSFGGIGDGLLLSLLERCMLLSGVLGAPVADVFVESTVSQSDCTTQLTPALKGYRRGEQSRKSTSIRQRWW